MKKRWRMLLKQSSTWRGLALIASGVALATGNAHLFSAEINDTGVHVGGLIGDTVGILTPIAIGLYDTIRNQHERG